MRVTSNNYWLRARQAVCLVFVFFSLFATAQKTNIPKEPRDFRPSYIKLSYDMIPLGVSIFSDARVTQEFQASIDFDQFFFAVEYGTQKSERGESYSYTNEGNYFSFGPEINMLKNSTNGNALTFGLRYGQANFNDQLFFSQPDSLFFGGGDISVSNPDLVARWLELTVGIQANVWKNLYLGYSVRYKVLRKVTGIDEFAPYDVPGFGLYEDNTGVRFNFYVGWAIPLREKFPEETLVD